MISKNKNVALIAIAKDEDTYIHEWIHHHLYLGFSPIYIGVNRTSDKTLEIINKISETEKEVFAVSLDWIDKTGIGLNKRIQNIGYAYLSTQIDKNSVEYVGFLDIDEFWFNVEGKKIQNFIDDSCSFDIASFFWLCQLGEESKFLPPFKNVRYEKSRIVKSIIRTNTLEKVEFFTFHVPTYNEKYYRQFRHIDQDGKSISSLNDNKIFNRQIPNLNNQNISSCVLHRMIRSETEYMSLVLRGRPNGELIKSNYRSGFKKAQTKLPEIFGEEYYLSLDHFIVTHKLKNILKSARINKLSFYQDKIESLNSNQLVAEIDNAIIALNNTIGLNAFVDAFVKNVKDIASITEFAIKLESIDSQLSNKLMQLAHNLRPMKAVMKNIQV